MLKLFQRTEEGTPINIFLKTSITLTPESKTLQESLMNSDVKIINKIVANKIQQYIKGIIHSDQVGFIPRMEGWFKI